RQFLQFACFGEKSRSLSTIRYFLNQGIVPPYMEVPVDVLPFNISKNFKNHKDFETWFNWKELSLVTWAKFIVEKPDLERDLKFARNVHTILAKSLNGLSKRDK